MKPALGFSKTAVRRVTAAGEDVDIDDVIAVEEPLEIRIGFPDGRHKAVSITMRTPGHDGELAAGFLFTEGILTSHDQIKQIRHCGPKGGNPSGSEGALSRKGVKAGTGTLPTGRGSGNTIRVDLNDNIDIDLKRLERNFYTTSSCGVCGKSSIEALRTGVKKLAMSSLMVSDEVIHGLPAAALRAQTAFEKTGGLHASVLFDLDGRVDAVAEDVGRHNALDKVIGRGFIAGEIPLSDKILFVSGRASFELVQKALMAGIPILAAVGAPSSLAVELAQEYGMTLIGFVRDERFNIYCGGERINITIPLVN